MFYVPEGFSLFREKLSQRVIKNITEEIEKKTI